MRPAVARLTPWFLLALTYAFLFGLQIMYEVLLAVWVVAALASLAGKPRWGWFAVFVGAGLMTKGPVMLLHVAFPLLLGPWWSEHARASATDTTIQLAPISTSSTRGHTSLTPNTAQPA